MKLNSFREILLRKTDNNPELNTVIQFMDEDLLADYAAESLKKMAEHKRKQGRRANALLARWGTHMNVAEPWMMHDALSHHASHYKAALKADNQDLANQHANKVWGLMRLLQKSSKHVGDNISHSAVAPHAWEQNKYKSTVSEESNRVKTGRKKAGQKATAMRGWNYVGNDFEHLQKEPHDDYKGSADILGHDKAYPMEQINVTIPGHGKKHIHVDDDVKADKFVPHVMDKHPILNNASMPAKDMHHTAMQNIWNQYKDFVHSDDVMGWAKSHNDKDLATHGKEPATAIHPLPHNGTKAPPPPGNGVDYSQFDPKLLAELGIKKNDEET
jgi:hypothetical protein